MTLSLSLYIYTENLNLDLYTLYKNHRFLNQVLTFVSVAEVDCWRRPSCEPG